MKIDFLLSFLLVLIFSVTSAWACVLSENFLDNPDLTTNCSNDIKDFAERVSECVHWVVEDAYDKERAEQISKSVEKLYCDTVGKDGEELLKKI